jgi:nitroreductase
MITINKKFLLKILTIILFARLSIPAQDIELPGPQIEGGLPLMEAINKRKSTRDFSTKEVTNQILSNLLWAAYGFNRPEQRMRTVPSAWNVHYISIYVAKADGLFLYDAEKNILKLILKKDVRSNTGTQNFVKDVPINLIYVADLAMMKKIGDKAKFYSAAQTGFIAQNVYLFCSSFNLGTVVRDMIDRVSLK